MNSDVECYSGSFHPERPRVIVLGGKRFQIDRILSEWLSPDSRCFKVLTTENEIFEITYDMKDANWEVFHTGSKS